MKTVEFRLVQVVLSQVGGDRLTVGLVHWDGSEVRSATSFRGVPSASKKLIERAVRLQIARFKRSVPKQPALDFGLANLLHVREGLGASLMWTPTRRGRTRNAQAHFDELASMLRLESLARTRGEPSESVRSALVDLGRGLQADVGDKVLINHPVQRKQTYNSPLSWTNGRWHHVIIADFSRAKPDRIDVAARASYGIARLAIPMEAVPVVVTVPPCSRELRDQAEKEVEVIRDALEEDGVLAQVIPLRRGVTEKLDYSELEKKIQADLKSAAE